ncbi:MAG: ribosomal protein S18-alanine N-acetyltransferase [Gammaproteobacteria bacterium]
MSRLSVTTALPAAVRLRPMRESDLPAVHRLETMSQPFPWPLWLFRRQLREGASCWVLAQGQSILGFGVVAVWKQRAHIMNICVAPRCRRRGWGRHIMLQLLRVARHHHCRQAWLEVRSTNRPAILLYQTLGFRTEEVRKGYYPARRGRQDGLIMVRLLEGVS